jgi:hypothetical protein
MRIENRQALASVHVAVRKTEVHRKLRKLREVLPGVSGFVAFAADVQDRALWKDLEHMLPSVRVIADQVAFVGMMPDLAEELSECVREVVMDALLDDLKSSWARLTQKAKEIEARFNELISECEQRLESERERLLTEQALGDEKEMKRVLRHRKALQSERDRALSTYKVTRELVQGAPAQGTADSYAPIVVELRLAGSTSEVVPQKK